MSKKNNKSLKNNSVKDYKQSNKSDKTKNNELVKKNDTFNKDMQVGKTKKRSRKRSNRSKNTKQKLNENVRINNQKVDKVNKNVSVNKKIDDKKNINNKKNIIIFMVVVILLLVLLVILFKNNYIKKQQVNSYEWVEDVSVHLNEFVITNKDATIYTLNKHNRYVKAGVIASHEELTLDIDYKDEYFKIISFDEEYYINYKDVDSISKLTDEDTRYKRYIAFNKNIVTKRKTHFYDKDGNLVYIFNRSFEFPVYVNKDDRYGVLFNDKLLYVYDNDVSDIEDSVNTRLSNTKGIAVLNYHFFYDEALESERKDCNQKICHSKSSFIKHLDYIKNNNIFTPTMDEFEMYLNKEINLPKSVLITIDDGWRTDIATQLLEKYQLNATIFLITSWFEKIEFLNNSKYVEYHSHGDNLHNAGQCPGGQGGAIKCLEKDKLLEDLELSRQKLGGTTAFCYPFYEYNDYSISVLKEAGFTLGFALGQERANFNTDRYKIPRYVIYDTTTVNQLRNYIG